MPRDNSKRLEPLYGFARAGIRERLRKFLPQSEQPAPEAPAQDELSAEDRALLEAEYSKAG